MDAVHPSSPPIDFASLSGEPLGMTNSIDEGARLIQQVLAELGWNGDASVIAANVRRLDQGLPAEDEFTAVCAWLGQTELLHKLDQHQSPASSLTRYQVPDLLAHFAAGGPFLIEVKAKKTQTLSFRPDYHQRLRAHADLLGMPLLIAWKYHAVWTLFDIRHMKKRHKNFNITFGEALKENLLGVLAGDVAYTIEAGAGVSFRFRKEQLLDVTHDEESTIEQWQMRVDQVHFTRAGGVPATDLAPEVATLFTTWDLEQSEVHSPTHVDVAFRAGAEGSMFGHMALVHLLNWVQPAGEPINWRHAIRRDEVVANMTNFVQALERGLQQKVVRYIFRQQPQTWPDFLPARPSSTALDPSRE